MRPLHRFVLSFASAAALVAFSAPAQAAAPPEQWARPPHRVHGAATSAPTGYAPAQVRHAYGFDALAQTGAGQTIAIVDAFDDPNAASDLQKFDATFGLPNPPTFTFTKAYAQGGKPRTDGGWALEISLDIEWAHAVAPAANILLVEARNNSFSNLLGAVDYAVNHGASVVSMSWGASDFAGESSYDSHFNHPGVTFIASAGDSGGVVDYPSASPYVLSVGGTTLPLDASGNRTAAETAWSSGGGGVSANESQPGYQYNFGLRYNGRATPDVAYNGDPNTGVSVYDTTPYYGQTGWFQVGGTSAGSPQWAGLTSLANQYRTATLTSSNVTSSPEYNGAGTYYASNYTDITSGSNGYSATTGYDLATGLGSPLARYLVPWLSANG